MDVYLPEIGAKIKHLRGQRGMSQIALAKQLGVSKSVVSSYETVCNLPPYDVLIRMARIFGSARMVIACGHGREHQLCGLQPAQLLDLRAVRETAHHIAFNGAFRDLVDPLIRELSVSKSDTFSFIRRTAQLQSSPQRVLLAVPIDADDGVAPLACGSHPNVLDGAGALNAGNLQRSLQRQCARRIHLPALAQVPGGILGRAVLQLAHGPAALAPV